MFGKNFIIRACVLALLIFTGDASAVEEVCGEAGFEMNVDTNRVTINPGVEKKVDILAALRIDGYVRCGAARLMMNAKKVDPTSSHDHNGTT